MCKKIITNNCTHSKPLCSYGINFIYEDNWGGMLFSHTEQFSNKLGAISLQDGAHICSSTATSDKVVYSTEQHTVPWLYVGRKGSLPRSLHAGMLKVLSHVALCHVIILTSSANIQIRVWNAHKICPWCSLGATTWDTCILATLPVLSQCVDGIVPTNEYYQFASGTVHGKSMWECL